MVFLYGFLYGKQTAIVYRDQAFHYEEGGSSNHTVFFESYPNPICLLQDEGAKVSGNGTLRQGFDLAMVDVTLPFQRQLVLAERKLERQKKINLVTINNFL